MLPDNYFELYDLPVGFYIDEKELRQRYLEISREYHPDGYTLADEETRQEVETITAYNNQAYKTLGDFNARLAYVLKIRGELGNEEDEQRERITDLDFLDEMMELNEALMELEMEENPDLYQKTANRLEINQKRAFGEVEALLKSYDDSPQSRENLKKIKNFYKKLKYFLRVSEKLSIFASAYKK